MSSRSATAFAESFGAWWTLFVVCIGACAL
jgi:hypothetical protein